MERRHRGQKSHRRLVVTLSAIFPSLDPLSPRPDARGSVRDLRDQLSYGSDLEDTDRPGSAHAFDGETHGCKLLTWESDWLHNSKECQHRHCHFSRMRQRHTRRRVPPTPRIQQVEDEESISGLAARQNRGSRCSARRNSQ